MLIKISQLQNSKSRGHCYFWENLQDTPNNLGSEECCSDLQKCIYEHPLGAQQCNANPFKANFPSFLPRKNPNALQFCPIFHPPTDIAQMPKDLPLIRGFSFQIAGNHLCRGQFSVHKPPNNCPPESCALEHVGNSGMGVGLVALVGFEGVPKKGGQVLVHRDRL